MGYYTRHTLAIRNHTLDQVAPIISALCEKDILNYALVATPDVSSHEIFFDCYDEAKWYDSDEHILEISEKFPNCVFLLEGEGEESPDLWKTYFKNGEMEHCRAVIYYPEPKKIIWD